jgi:predicted metal-dependent phosphoesterase TrpH
MSTRPFDPAKPIDLHLHSNESDGTESPAQVVQAAADAGLGTIALTDHDTMAGWDEAGAAARRLGLSLIPGIEFSTQIELASVHILGYLLDPHDRHLVAELDRIRNDRVTRAERMVEAIGRDFPLKWDDVLAEAQEGATIGRPHIADALARKGLVADRNEAFASILHWQGGYFQPHRAPHPTHAIELIHEAGGVAVLAHGGSRGRRAMSDGNFPKLVAAGLDGVEIGHRENDELARSLLRGYARKHELIVTGSSDYHGAGKPNQLGENTTDPAELERIIARATGTKPVVPHRER